MTVTAIGPIERTIHTTNSWLEELKTDLNLEDRQQAYHVLRVVLHSLRDRLTLAETVELGAQLPMLVRGLYYEGWSPKDQKHKERKKEQFMKHITEALRETPELEPEGVATGVFRVLEKHVSEGEIGDIKSILPAEIRALWPAHEAGHGS